MNNARLIGYLILVLMSVSVVLGTGQEPDKIVYKGVEKMLFANPLEDYYSRYPEKRPHFMIEPITMSSANWRGYVASWEIAYGKLYLTEVDSWICKNASVKESCRRVELSQLFPGKVVNGKVLAEWFTGKLRVPDGELLQYVHMGYGSTYERDFIFDVKSGLVGEPETIENTNRDLPSSTEAARLELGKLKESPLGNQPAFGPAQKIKAARNRSAKKEPKSGISIVPGQGVFSVGTKKKRLEAVLGDGEPGSKFDAVYFVEYPKAGVQVSYENRKDVVHVIFLYNNQARHDDLITPKVRTDKGIDWSATPEDILRAYGKPVKDFSDSGPVKSWRRMEYPGIDFLFEGGQLGRIGILGPDGN